MTPLEKEAGYRVPPILEAALTAALKKLPLSAEFKACPVDFAIFEMSLFHAANAAGMIDEVNERIALETGDKDLDGFQRKVAALIESFDKLSHRTLLQFPCGLQAVVDCKRLLEAVATPNVRAVRQRGKKKDFCKTTLSRDAFAIYSTITGLIPTRSNDAGPYGAFHDFLTELFEIFNIKADVDYYARIAIEDHKAARMVSKGPLSPAFPP